MAAADWFQLARPHFLVGGFAFYGLGAVLAAANGAPPTAPSYIIGQAFVTMTQLAVHIANEVHDVAADRANANRTTFSGGSHVLADDRLPIRSARLAARALFGCAALLAAALFLAANPAAAMVAAATLFLSWAYSAPPLRLHSRGVGGLVAATVVAGLVPLLALAQASPPWSPLSELTWTFVPLVLHTAALVGVLSLPDTQGDATAGKRTLSVRIGVRRAGRVLQTSWIVGGLVTLASIAAGRPPWFAFPAGCALALAIAFPVLAGTRRWDFLALSAAGLVAVQWAATMAALLTSV